MLRKGQRFAMGGRIFKVHYVNASRAHCVAQVPTVVAIKDRTFTALRRITVDISPNSGVAVLAEVERSARQ